MKLSEILAHYISEEFGIDSDNFVGKIGGRDISYGAYPEDSEEKYEHIDSEDMAVLLLARDILRNREWGAR